MGNGALAIECFAFSVHDFNQVNRPRQVRLDRGRRLVEKHVGIDAVKPGETVAVGD